MKIVIATGIYPPDVGGPAYYAEGLAEAFRRSGQRVTIVTYGWIKKLPTGLRHMLYALKLFFPLARADAVIALDTFSVAVPAAMASAISRTPLIVRTGGDFLWEQYVKRDDSLPLVHFYDRHRPFSRQEKLIFRLTKFALRRARAILFSTKLQRDVWLAPYQIEPVRTRIVRNAVEAPLPSDEPKKKNYLWHVRANAIKNETRVRAAFAKAKSVHPGITLEEGVIPKQELLRHMKSCYAVILPSLTEISPNYILDALRFKKPFIMDKYSGFARWLAPYGTLVDPLDEDDIARAIGMLAEPERYRDAVRKAGAFSYVRTYDDVARDFLAIIAESRLA